MRVEEPTKSELAPGTKNRERDVFLTSPRMMPPAYLDLAHRRATSHWPGYKQPEQYGYDFREWVSPYTKGAHALGSVAVVLQDWSSEDVLLAGVDADVQEFGRTRDLRTNRMLERLLERVLGLSLPAVYVTNVFPFVKPGAISSRVPRRDALRSAREFAQRELELADPTMTLALGRLPTAVLQEVGVPCIGLPHPAARIGGLEQHEGVWRRALGR